MAEYERTSVGSTYLYGAINVREQFYYNFKGIRAVKSVNSYF